MLSAVIISPNRDLQAQLDETLRESPDVSICKSLGEYPPPDVLKRLMRVWAPDIVFISIEQQDAVENINHQLKTDFPTVLRVGLSVDEDPVALRAALRWGMAELLTPPFARAPLAAVVSDLKHERELNPVAISTQNHFCAFVPAKGGVGASTIAASAARALGSVPDMSVLLADFDLYSGVGGFLFNVEHEFNMSDAASMSKTLDEDTWERLIHKSDDIDLLLSSGPTAAIDQPIRETELGRIIDFAHRNYSVVCADLPDSFDDRSLSILREATRIFIVTTPELPALRVARLKAMTLQKLDWADKAALVVNRVTRSMELSLQEIEQTVGLPLFSTFPSEYADVTRAARTGSGAPKLAAAAREFASKLLNKKFEKKRSRFIERFAVVPAAYSFK